MHFERFPVPVVTPVLNFIARILPKKCSSGITGSLPAASWFSHRKQRRDRSHCFP
jgi:hypothetical protein